MRKLLSFWLAGTVAFAANAETLINTNANWRYLTGLTEASQPDPTAWRGLGFDDTWWTNGMAPFYFGTNFIGQTALADMPGNYTCVFLRKYFFVTNAAAIAQLQLNVRCNDGFIAWINWNEVARFNLPTGSVAFTGTASGELSGIGPAQMFTSSNPKDYLFPGTNILAVQAFSAGLTNDADFFIDLSLTSMPDTTPPTAVTTPADGATVSDLSTLEVDFSKPVTGVDATNLLINGSASAILIPLDGWQYLFQFSAPPTGTVQVAWATNQSITDLAGNPFAGGSWYYNLTPAPPPQISEFMAANQSTLKDEDGDSSDWIELFNPSSQAVNLAGWALTDDPTNLMAWTFPDFVLQPESYLVVFASGKNRTNVTAELHTNFKLSASGEFLALVDPATNLVSAFTPMFPPQTSDVSYGRDPISPDLTGYFTVPTPGKPNLAPGAFNSAPVLCSRLGGTFVSPFSLQLAVASSNAVIHFTQDGSLPTDASPLYMASLLITNSVQIRARSFTPGLLPGPITNFSLVQLDPGMVSRTADLPLIILCNFGAGTVPASDSQSANLSFYEPQNGITSLTNAPTLSVRAGVHARGSSTLGLPDQSWAVEFWNDLNGDQNYSPLGLPAESDWVLYSPDFYEPVMIHNPLIYQLSNEIGRYAPRTRLAALYLNTSGKAVSEADYNGIYVLEEKIKIGKNRVSIVKLNETDNSPTSVTGGYLVKVDRLDLGDYGFVAADQTNAYVNPDESDINTPQRAPQKQYLQNYLDAFGAALSGTNYLDPTNGYRAFVDVASWIDYHILNVMTFNVDALRLSAFFSKDRNGKLVFGPIWDFDRSQGSNDSRDYWPRIWCSPLGTDYFNYSWWGRLFTDPDFWQAWIDRYQDLRAGALSTNHIFADIDVLANQLRAEQVREAARWPSWNAAPYQDRVDFLKQWYADRLDFMDTNFLARPVCNQNGGGVPPGFLLTLTSPNGAAVYYTTNGADPRLPNGGIDGNAQRFSGPVILQTNAIILARAYDLTHSNLTGPLNPPLSSPWSGLFSNAFQTVTAPVVTQSPLSVFAYVGQAPAFTVAANGSPPPVFQWQFNGADLDSQTNTQLILTNVQLSQSGPYSVVISNSAGSINLPFTLTVTTKPRLVITEVMSSEARNTQGSTLDHMDWWELTDLDTFAVNLRGFRLDDSSASLIYAFTFTNDVMIQPGESVVFVEDMSADAFRTWWGAAALPPGLKILTYNGSGLGLDNAGDAVNLWNAVATSDTDKVASVTFGTATRGITFGYNASTGTFGGLSVAGQNGAFVAAVNGDVGSPGTIVNLPKFTGFIRTNGQFKLTVFTQPLRNYEIQFKNSLNEPVWQTLTNVTSAPNPFICTDPLNSTNAARFYRAVMVQ